MRIVGASVLFVGMYLSSIFAVKQQKHLLKSALALALPKTPPRYVPKSPTQSHYVNLLGEKNIPVVVGVGPAGCGKTLFACITAMEKYKAGLVDKIILTRPLVTVENEQMGFLPGSIQHKTEPWTIPMFDIFHEMASPKEIEKMLVEKKMEICPLGFMRGRTFKNCWIIADEMQNSTPTQMLMLATRLGENTKLVITGDLQQSDRGYDSGGGLWKGTNGLGDFIEKIRARKMAEEDGFGVVEFHVEDVERSAIVRNVLSLYGGGGTRA